MRNIIILIVITCATFIKVFAQAEGFTAVQAVVHFDKTLQDWDGFGFNYVETAHSYDYEKFKQEYGGFSLLNEKQKSAIIDLVFGEDGLKVGLVKMFLSALDQKEAKGAFDHETHTSHMRFFVKEGLKKTKSWGGNIDIITTLYGPPAFVTKQKVGRGRDLDPAHKDALANYMVDWVKFLKEKEKLPVKYLSLHNEGEDWSRWTTDGLTSHEGHDYNLFWPVEQVNDFLHIMPGKLAEAGLGDVKMTPGETSNWYRFYYWGYAGALAQDSLAMKNIGLITSHGFYSGYYGAWFGEHTSAGNDVLRKNRPDLHSWVTSTSWSNMDARNIKEMHGNIYTAKVNGIIPWAGIQRPQHWPLKDPNPGCAIRVNEDSTYEVTRGYYFYKQLTRAGQPGMKVAETTAMNSEIVVIGFAAVNSKHKDAVVIANIAKTPKKVALKINGAKATAFHLYRTVRNESGQEERYKDMGVMTVNENVLSFEMPIGSVYTFFAE